MQSFYYIFSLKLVSLHSLPLFLANDDAFRRWPLEKLLRHLRPMLRSKACFGQDYHHFPWFGGFHTSKRMLLLTLVRLRTLKVTKYKKKQVYDSCAHHI